MFRKLDASSEDAKGCTKEIICEQDIETKSSQSRERSERAC
ncbi:hypothetical protein CES85_1132 [Ochrobactrum quorumnocens]|uniref:Uncharacterized protein n=1 Tax=Ochrobactrum quorumnocens TaxID=271865 RepID=A0A248UF04_9HYPH|nr:hypothetical protein CES85_1132 [[Ochrobactrum] quorumnocens]